MTKQEDLVSYFKKLASFELDSNKVSKLFEKEIREAFLIRSVENTFLDLFKKGSMNGTVHTCVGQEFSAVAVCSDLLDSDWVTSSHRCHGHFISKTKNWKNLIDELRGFKSGVCMGIGSSQHLFRKGFLSNGPQGALLPVATGMGVFFKKNSLNNIVVSFIGEGTLGQGVLYETLNLDSILETPHLFVLENNLYSQSTPQANAISGNILERPGSFNIKTFETNTWDIEHLFSVCKEAKDFVRTEKKPAFLKINTYRLNAHSKSDDDRDLSEIQFFIDRDPLQHLLKENYWKDEIKKIKMQIDLHLESSDDTILSLSEYSKSQLPSEFSFQKRYIKNPKERMVHSLNKAYFECLNDGSFFLGEDIADPYGGAFKVTKGFSEKYPNLVISSPISESAIVGVGIGLSIMGNKPFVEIMFGDFTTHIFDQLISNASKFYHMYGFQISSPVRVRTPMGGKRGYGPTHSQSLEKFFLGIDNLLVIALSSLDNPEETIKELQNFDCPALLIENKTDYGKVLFQNNDFLKISKIGAPFGIIHAIPTDVEADIAIVSYGGTAREIVDAALEIFLETEIIIEVFCLVSLSPLILDPVINSLKGKVKGLVIVEDHSSNFGIGAEIVCRMAESSIYKPVKRIGAKPYPIPSVKALEDKILPTKDYIIEELKDFFGEIYG